jgi:hypothetical protein
MPPGWQTPSRGALVGREMGLVAYDLAIRSSRRRAASRKTRPVRSPTDVPVAGQL